MSFLNEAGQRLSRITVAGRPFTSDLTERTLAARLELASSMVSQLTLTIADPSEDLLYAGFGAKGTDVTYGPLRFQVGVRSAIDTQGVLCLQLTCRSLGGMALQRAYGPLARSNLSPTQMMAAECSYFGLSFVGPPSPARPTITRVTNETTQESSWAMGQRLASELGWVAFESTGVYFFAPPTWLVANLPKTRVAWTGATTDGRILGRPTVRDADDSTRSPIDRQQAVTGTVSVVPEVAEELFPGHVLVLDGMPGYDGPYWVTAVSGDLGGAGVFGVSFSSPVDPEPVPVAEDVATGTAAAGSAPAAAASRSGAGIVEVARSMLGKPYRYGGTSPAGFDCSGLVQYCYAHGAGISIPRTSEQQGAAARAVPRGSEQPGDIAFYTANGDTYHCGLVIGGGLMIAAPHSGTAVRQESYTLPHLSGFGRFW